MPYYAGGMLASKIAHYVRNSAGRIYPSLFPTFAQLAAQVACFPSLGNGCKFLLRFLIGSLSYVDPSWTSVIL